ncbi:hypothetical protein [Ralstonia pseudosolanacearum]|uniref:Transmembrane protein n=1 Tax=Ralstonia solanacearum TaxID=305 RepID=A0AA92EHP4_RALSL|nr:hypothetical protein [Ralstonia pseudosolanacearum]QCX51426.1 hypothetical protein E7Z57_20420 [Ralstonia pseudosolanacearum]
MQLGQQGRKLIDGNLMWNRGRLISRGMAVTLSIIAVVVGVLVFGNFEKPISRDISAARFMIVRMGGLNKILSGCEFDSNGNFSRCDGLSERLALIKKAEDEEIIATEKGELVGVNFLRRVIVVLKPRKGPDGRIDFSCAVWPEKAAPRGCRDTQRSE